MAALKISYKIYLEAEDVSQSRIQSCTSFVDEIIKNHANPYIARAELTNENDMDDFIVRLYANEEITEETCGSGNDAKAFIDDMVDLLFDIAHMHSFLDMEGSFSMELDGEKRAYTFRSESGDSLCDFEEENADLKN